MPSKTLHTTSRLHSIRQWLTTVSRYSQSIRKQVFSIYPASIDSSANLLLNAERAGWAIVEIKDVNGKTLLSQGMAVDKGFNKIPILFIPLLKQGTHTLVLRVDESIYSSLLVRK